MAPSWCLTILQRSTSELVYIFLQTSITGTVKADDSLRILFQNLSWWSLTTPRSMQPIQGKSISCLQHVEILRSCILEHPAYCETLISTRMVLNHRPGSLIQQDLFAWLSVEGVHCFPSPFSWIYGVGWVSRSQKQTTVNRVRILNMEREGFLSFRDLSIISVCQITLEVLASRVLVVCGRMVPLNPS